MKTAISLLFITLFLACGEKHTNMNPNEIIFNRLNNFIQTEIKESWKKITIEMLMGERVSSDGIFFHNENDIEEKIYSNQYRLPYELRDELRLLGLSNNEEKWNKLNFVILADHTYTIQKEWDEAHFNQDVAFKEASQKSENIAAKFGNFTEKPIDLDKIKARYKTTPEVDIKMKRVASFGWFIENMLGEFYSRLFTLFGEPSYILVEGFGYIITDLENNLHFSVGLSQSGLGYYAEEETELILDQLQEFDNLLFSKHLKIQDCAIKVGNDFGNILLGAKDGVPYEILEEFDFDDDE